MSTSKKIESIRNKCKWQYTETRRIMNQNRDKHLNHQDQIYQLTGVVKDLCAIIDELVDVVDSGYIRKDGE